MPRFNFANHILCDMATPGSNNKFTLVNVYPTDILIPHPAVISLSLYLEHIADRDGILEFSLFYNLNGADIVEFNVKAIDLQKNKIGVFIVPPMALPLEAGKLRLIAKGNGYHNTTIFTKNVVIGPVS